MSLSVGELKKVSVQSIRDIAAGLRAKAASMRATQAGVTDLPHKGTWTGVAADNADHEIGHFAKGVGRDAEAYENAGRKVDGAGDEFEGLKQLLARLENEAAGKFAINEATGEVTPLTKDFNKSDRDYIAATLKQLCAAGGQANDDLAAGIHATDASGATTPAGAAGGPLPEMPGSAIKPDGVVGGMQNLAAPNPDGAPGATKAAAATASGDTINYKELYPKTPGAGDKLTIDPSKAGSLTGTVGALDKMPGAPKPQDGFGSGVAKQFLKGANDRVDGTIDEVKSKAGLNGADKFAESWTNSAKGLEHQIERTLFPGAAMAEDAKNMIDQAVTSYQHPEQIPENIGKTTVDGAIIGGTAPLGGEGALGRLGIEESAAARGALTDSRGMLHDLPGGHLFDGPSHPNVDAPSGGHSSGEIGPFTGEHSGTIGDHGGPSHAPDLNHVSTESGGTGAWNHDLNNPEPNTHYNVDNRFEFTTDDAKRSTEMHGSLDLDNPSDRNGYRQSIAGGDDRLPGDHGGHIFGRQFGGPGEAINLTAMDGTLNRVGYANLENEWRTLIQQGHQVEVKVNVTYPGNSMRPDMYEVHTFVDGKLDSVKFLENR
ncbi:Uncharacterised protein [Mycobacteroides abscessus subsp. abscessus]|uniref:DNA/RNA non-specific endonuclease n=1 Tax=Mycobacteroides abscessus TaxID=36809 RepID=UPI000927B6C6|nr:DNA/RNA non-specific endonuclease [Mycobacteroides abscessus]MDO3315716.1 DNA/RNA non-specific endonuclease [Mycobacteroides abscessus subsp. abscessus]MDO3343103.1 DNA/RNA non-specific endonuclease [Mycobacteroides abscessus subsp. abscessus]SHP28855.1 Uncharacterised protein [Mycobacteroides abscessus subsp. abscessus]SHP45682.1 Uncharacterised protein [Mycobacteroides abscessus subsp. abscessus]SHP49718.1 Uncharacterised protein [Mycobacteroides abscessus subsp. abscessus]